MILVTGASGTTGRATIDALLAAGAPVRAFVREPQAELPAGVERAEGSFQDAASVASALKGVERVYLMGIPGPGLLEQEAAFLQAAAGAGVRHIVRLSILRADSPEPPHLVAAAHGAADRALIESGIAWTILHPNAFAQNLLAQASAIAGQGIYATPLSASALVSHVDAVDIGAVAAAVLTQSGHEGHAYRLTGPQALNDDDIATALSEVLGRPVTHVQAAVQDAKDGLLAAGLPDFLVEQFASLWTYLESGGAAAVYDDVPRLLGRPAGSTRAVIERHRSAFTAADAG